MTGKNPKLLGNNLPLSDEELKLVAGGTNGEPGQVKVTCLSCNWTTGWNSPQITRAKYLEHRGSNSTHTEYKTEYPVYNNEQ